MGDATADAVLVLWACAAEVLGYYDYVEDVDDAVHVEVVVDVRVNQQVSQRE